jgi:hypothetical protein
MIQIKEIGVEGREQWNQYVNQTPEAIAWQVYDWSEVVRRHYQFQFIPLAAFEEKAVEANPDESVRNQGRKSSTVVGVLPLYRGRVGNKQGLISVPFAVAGGIVADSDMVRTALLNRAIEISESLGGLPITLKQYKVRMPGALKTDNSFFNRELRLQQPPESLQQEVRASNLSQAEQAIKAGLEVEYPSSNVKEFYDLLLRYHSAQGLPCASEAWVRTLVDFGMYSIALARIEGSLVAGTLVKQFKKTVSFPFSCARSGGRFSESAPLALYWHLIQHFASKGFEIFHSGRIPQSESVAEFRLGWGGTAYPYYYQTYPDRGESAAGFDTRGNLKRRLVSRLWKELPLGIARRLGPVIVGKFP